jgi:hypothetical protein
MVGRQLCEMLGYKYSEDALEYCNALQEKDIPKVNSSDPWGHITADGTIANAESMWCVMSLSFKSNY